MGRGFSIRIDKNTIEPALECLSAFDAETAVIATANQLAKDAKAAAPRDTGGLANSVRVEVDESHGRVLVGVAVAVGALPAVGRVAHQRLAEAPALADGVVERVARPRGRQLEELGPHPPHRNLTVGTDASAPSAASMSAMPARSSSYSARTFSKNDVVTLPD